VHVSDHTKIHDRIKSVFSCKQTKYKHASNSSSLFTITKSNKAQTLKFFFSKAWISIWFSKDLPWEISMHCWSKPFTGLMSLLATNEQCQNSEGMTYKKLSYHRGNAPVHCVSLNPVNCCTNVGLQKFQSENICNKLSRGETIWPPPPADRGPRPAGTDRRIVVSLNAPYGGGHNKHMTPKVSLIPWNCCYCWKLTAWCITTRQQTMHTHALPAKDLE